MIARLPKIVLIILQKLILLIGQLVFAQKSTVPLVVGTVLFLYIINKEGGFRTIYPIKTN